MSTEHKHRRHRGRRTSGVCHVHHFCTSITCINPPDLSQAQDPAGPQESFVRGLGRDSWPLRWPPSPDFLTNRFATRPAYSRVIMGPRLPCSSIFLFFRAPAIDPHPSDLAIEFVRMRRARRYIVRVRHDGISSRDDSARRIARRSRSFRASVSRPGLQETRAGARRTRHAAWTDGATLMLRGELVDITLRRGRRRCPNHGCRRAHRRLT